MPCTVVIPCHNGAHLTRACLASLLAQDSGPPTEILLVDNASTDQTADLATMHPAVRVLRQNRNRGFAGGVNVGLRAARGARLMVLNNDTQAAPNLIAELMAVLDSDASIGAVAPRSNFVKGEALLAVGAAGATAAGRQQLAAALEACPAPAQDVHSLAGLCLLLRRTTLERVGVFDERFGHGNFEDDDFCLRMRLQGHRLVVANRAFLHHEGHATFHALGLDIGTELARRRAQFEAKWQCDPAGRAVFAALRGDLDDAARWAAVARRVWPQWPEADWLLAQAARARGAAASAASHLRAFLRQCPAHVEAQLQLGLELLAAGDPAGPRALDTVARIHPLSTLQLARLTAGLAAAGTSAAAPSVLTARATTTTADHSALLATGG